MDWEDISTMSKETNHSAERSERKELPIERGFPIERINEIAEKESRAKQWYRPVYTMHKWWARRLGCVFRSILLYSLLDDPEKVEVREPGENGSLSDYGEGHSEVRELIDNVEMVDPESLWELYPKDVRVQDKRILDPFMGGGTSIVEATRFGAESIGSDLNPVAWFITKKELDAGQTDVDEVQSAYEDVKEDVADEIRSYYRTECPNDSSHDADVMYNFWVKELDCTACGSSVPLLKDYRVGKARYADGTKYDVFCPSCDSIIRADDWQSETTCEECGYTYNPSEGNIGRGNYSCQDCGQKYKIIDAVKEQAGANKSLFAVEYYCSTCKENGLPKEKVKGYKPAGKREKDLYDKASAELENSTELEKYIPDTEIPVGIMTDSTAFEGSIGGGHNLLAHGYSEWRDLYNDRQLLLLAKLLKAIDDIEDQNAKEFLLLAFSDSLSYNTMLTRYQYGYNKIVHMFSTNSFDVPQEPLENNVWGAEQGAGSFSAMFDMIERAVEYANNPTERYLQNGDTVETPPFATPIGQNSKIEQADARKMDYDSEFDAVITDPPYYDNVIYSEISNYYYAWLRLILEDEYEMFQPEQTPGAESIVANPAQGKGTAEFEDDLREAFGAISDALVDDGVLAFTYHHSDSESWGELLEVLCDVGFEITATYPINADLQKHGTKIGAGDSVAFDIVVVGRPIEERGSISWNSLRRDIYRTAQRTQRRLEDSDRELSRGDIGVIEMGECFREYSKYHGKVRRAGEIMSAKEVVDEIYGIIQQGSDIGVIDVFLDLLETPDATYNDLNKLTRGTNASSEQMKDMNLYRRENGKFILGTWGDEKRMAYIQERMNGDDEALNALDKAQFLRYHYEQGKSTQNYLSKWDVDDELRELCEGLADATGDDTYRRILGADSSLEDFS
ncbi:hypothetical protein C494_08717 [Natronorubrum bangense JCM 10635]|uniref:DUF1156 domain-containing protein n=2 Tax=Natronorubrum bangense TaxID=61858 RepID=L9WLE9_9EURY|nr:hypothetical protein C494_08717 [Natronorubrum bangense JCM 10635]